MVGKISWTATIKDKITSEIEGEVMRRDVQIITEKNHYQQKIETATILSPIIRKIKTFSENFSMQKFKNL